jgi:uncharacterized protein YyaL (SSP411 family)
VLADWNGLAIAALARCGAVFSQPAWLNRAREAFDFIMTQMAAAHGGVEHAWRLGRVTAPGLIEDQAAMARAALALNEATGEPRYLATAERLVNAAEATFGDSHGGYFTTAVDAADVPFGRPRSVADNATPSGNGMMAEVLSRLFHLTGDTRWRSRADASLRACSGQADQLPGMPTLLAAADLLEEGASVVILGTNSAALAQVALSTPDPAVVVLRAPDNGSLPVGHPAYGKLPPPDGAAAYVCRRNVCGLPITDPGTLSLAVRTRL